MKEVCLYWIDDHRIRIQFLKFNWKKRLVYGSLCKFTVKINHILVYPQPLE